jgi:cytochrome c-type biogenesis protein CcmH/NrfG
VSSLRVDDRRTLWLFTGTALALGILIVLAGFQPSAVNWGVHFLGFLSPAGIAVVCLLFVLALLPWVQDSLLTTIGRCTHTIATWAPLRRRILAGTLLCAIGTLFWIVRQRTFFLGDGYLVIRTLTLLQQTGDIPGSFPTAPLSAMVAWQMMRMLGAFGVEQPALAAWQCVSIVAGMVSLTAIWKLSGMLWHEPSERVAGFVLIGMAGAGQLMFGYVETYPAAYALLWVYVLATFRSIRGTTHVAVATALFPVLCLFHLGMAILVPSLLYLWFITFQRDGWRALLVALVPALILSPVMLWVVHYEPSRLAATILRDGAHFLPVSSPDHWTDPFTLFSVWHIADVMNLFLFLAPFSLLMLGAFFVSAGLPRNARPAECAMWYTLGIPAAAWIFVNSFELGLSRDWDLAAPFGMMVISGALIVWHHVTPQGTARKRVMILMALVTAAATGSWIGIGANADHALERFGRLQDPRLWAGSALADAYEEVGGYYRDRGQMVEAAESFARCVAVDSTNARRWIQLAGTVANMGDGATALRAYDRAMSLGTKDPLAHLNAGIIEYQRGRTAEGIERVRTSLALDPACAPAVLTLGTMLLRDGRHDVEALRWLERAVQLDSSDDDARQRAAFCRRRIMASRQK